MMDFFFNDAQAIGRGGPAGHLVSQVHINAKEKRYDVFLSFLGYCGLLPE